MDEDLQSTFYRDEEGDGYGFDYETKEACNEPDGYVAQAGDCEPEDPDAYPGATERCNGKDDDCDGVLSAEEADEDLDVWMVCEGDCDDHDRSIHPEADESCNGIDDNCDGVIASSEADEDGDGELGCADDCDDSDPNIRPGAVEICTDETDNDCDGDVDTDCQDCDLIVGIEAATIQGAIDAARDGEIVCVPTGTWTENLDFGGANVAVVGVHGAAATVLDGGGLGPVVRFASGESSGAALVGFTVQGGDAGKSDGGGIYVLGASPTLQGLVVTGNTNAGYPDLKGGGIYVEDGAPTLSSVKVEGNTALATSEVHYGHGGGVALVNSDALLDSVLVSGNQAGWSGSGLYLEDSTAVISASAVVDNLDAQSGGGGLYVSGGAPVFYNVVFANNESTEDYGVAYGGGAYLDGTDATFANSAFVGNRAWGVSGSSGGALYVSDSTVTFTNTVIALNTADDEGGGVAVASGTASFGYCDLYANTPDEVAGIDDPTGADGNVSEDPGFCDADLHLCAASPLVDAGDPSILDPDASTSDIGLLGGPGAGDRDLDGDGYPAWWLPGPYDAATSPDADCDDSDSEVYPGRSC